MSGRGEWWLLTVCLMALVGVAWNCGMFVTAIEAGEWGVCFVSGLSAYVQAYFVRHVQLELDGEKDTPQKP
jgi:hypothetical protein